MKMLMNLLLPFFLTIIFICNFAGKCASSLDEDQALHIVTFDSGNGLSNTSNNKKIKKGEKIAKPLNITRKDFVFDGWYTDKTFSYLYDFNTPIIKNITLCAKWISRSEYNQLNRWILPSLVIGTVLEENKTLT